MKKNKNLILTILIIILGCVVMAITDAIIKPPYFIKSIIKIVFFLVIPLLFILKSKVIHLKKMIIPVRKNLLTSLTLGISIYIIILVGYFLTKNFYDYSSITGLLTSNSSITGNNFIFVATYISFCNSLLEEFFFRGFAFFVIKKYLGRKLAYILSSISFAIYHIAIMTGWFSIILFILIMIGLVIGGCIFNYLDDKNENICNSWMTHMFANFAINTIGFILFGIIG